MTELTTASREVLLAELELHKTEFSGLRDEILHLMDAERQTLNMSLVAAGAGLSLSPFVLGPNTLVILLLFPLVFHVLLWEMLNAIRSTSRISSYLTGALIPRVNSILDELGSHRQGTMALGWETHIATLAMGKQELVLTSLTPTRHWMPILAVAGLLIAYAVAIRNIGYSPTPVEVGLILLNLVLLLWAAVQNIFTLRTYMRTTRKLIPVPSPRRETPDSPQPPKHKANHPKK